MYESAFAHIPQLNILKNLCIRVRLCAGDGMGYEYVQGGGSVYVCVIHLCYSSSPPLIKDEAV